MRVILGTKMRILVAEDERRLAGAIALVAAVPLTTALAALLVARVPTEALATHHGHVH